MVKWPPTIGDEKVTSRIARQLIFHCLFHFSTQPWQFWWGLAHWEFWWIWWNLKLCQRHPKGNFQPIIWGFYGLLLAPIPGTKTAPFYNLELPSEHQIPRCSTDLDSWVLPSYVQSPVRKYNHSSLHYHFKLSLIIPRAIQLKWISEVRTSY